MSDDRDLVLQNLFAEADMALDDSAFTAKVVRRSYGLVIRLGILAACMALLLLAAVVVLGLSPLEVAKHVSDLLTNTLFDLDEGWLAWALTPVNNLAGLLVLGLKAIRVLYKKVLRAP